MPDRYLKIRTVRRGTRAGVATYAAAYRAGETLVDERTGNLYKYGWRSDVKHSEIVLPTPFAADPRLDWARNRSVLWNAVEHGEARKDARVAREYSAVLPSELTHAQRVSLTRSFAQALADRHHTAVDFAIHEPRPGRSETHHAHLLASTRELTPTGLGPKAAIERRRLRYRKFMSREAKAIHGIWRGCLNHALRLAGKEAVPDSPWHQHLTVEITRHGGSPKFRGQITREDRLAKRPTPHERELIKERKRTLRARRKVELAQKKAQRNGRLRAKREAMTPQQIEAQRKKWRQWQRDRYQALPEARKEEIRERLNRSYYANREARLAKQREWHQKNAESANRKRAQRRAAAREQLKRPMTMEERRAQAVKEWQAFRARQTATKVQEKGRSYRGPDFTR